jgi:DNA-binding NarL/FixJ family response regulator
METELTKKLSRQISVLVVDSHRLLRECLVQILKSEDLAILEPAANRYEALSKIKSNNPEVVLISSALRDDSALDLAKELWFKFPHIKSVMYGMQQSQDDYVAQVEAGLRGYIFEHTSSLDELQRTIRQVVNGEIACPPEVTYVMFTRLNQLASEKWWVNRATNMKLTPREVEILELIAKGLNNREIGERLFLSLHTIKNHVHKILQKLQVSRRSDAVKYAHEKQWLRNWGHVKSLAPSIISYLTVAKTLLE